MARKHRFESSALRYLFDRFVGDDPERRAQYQESVANAKVAMQIYELRTRARLSQAELAKRVGTSRSVISRLEDADYEGHSLSLLRRVAASLGRSVEIRFVPRRRATALPADRVVRRKQSKRRRVA